MAKYELRSKARELRAKGASIKEIVKQLNISKSTASLWVRDIILTKEQIERLRQSEVKGKELGRLKSAFLKREKRLKLVENFKKKGIKKLNRLTDREILIAGLALYWGEGGKKNRRVEFCNSDPKMVQFLMKWLRKCFHININEIRCHVGINNIHCKRDQVIKEYWSKISGIPLTQFTQTSFKKVKNVKTYDNFEDHYGTFFINVKKSVKFYYQILGLIEGLYKNLAG